MCYSYKLALARVLCTWHYVAGFAVQYDYLYVELLLLPGLSLVYALILPIPHKDFKIFAKFDSHTYL